MGEHEIRPDLGEEKRRAFVQALLKDVQALELILESGRIESGVRRIGAEQEVFLVDESLRPANVSLEVLERLGDSRYTTELGLFNMEANQTPRLLAAGCLSSLEAELDEDMSRIRAAAAAVGARPLLVGILPTLEKKHLGLESMTPIPRFHELGRTMRDMRGGEFRTLIKGLDELHTSHDNVMLEACNTSFQIHFQVGAEEFAPLYNLAQAVTAPVLAAATNSPVLLRHRLWHETRVALFQQSLDTRSEAQTRRGERQRVSFGDSWIKRSVLEIFREDIARFRVLLSGDLEESPLEKLQRGEIPELKALRLHNGTVYRWNRPCYGVDEGKPHLRIENRVLPAGPTVIDEVANAAFYFGLMCGLSNRYEDITEVLAFDDAKDNFHAAARYGLDARLRWLEGRRMNADTLILQELLPLAHEGLESRGMEADAVRYLGVLEARVASRRTGSQWAFDSLAALGTSKRPSELYHALTAAMLSEQEEGDPVHTWKLATSEQFGDDRDSFRNVSQVMQSSLFTVGPEDLVDLAASLMDWEHIRHVPVEDEQGRLVGLVSHRQLLRMVGHGLQGANRAAAVAVKDIMKPQPIITVSPDTSILEAIEKMRAHGVGCLPVIEDGKLAGIVTEHDFVAVTARLLDRWLREE